MRLLRRISTALSLFSPLAALALPQAAWTREGDCPKTRQADTYPLPSKYDAGWFTDADQLAPPLTEKSHPTLMRQVVSEGEAARIFKEIAAEKTIPFRYIWDGCYARAHRIAQILEQKGIVTEKLFLEGNLVFDTPVDHRGYVEWDFHVAPVIKVRTPEGDMPMVIEPVLFDHLVSVKEWIRLQIRHNPKQEYKAYLRSRFTYMPGEETSQWRPEDSAETEKTLNQYLAVAEKTRLQEQKIQRVMEESEKAFGTNSAKPRE